MIKIPLFFSLFSFEDSVESDWYIYIYIWNNLCTSSKDAEQKASFLSSLPRYLQLHIKKKLKPLSISLYKSIVKRWAVLSFFLYLFCFFKKNFLFFLSSSFYFFLFLFFFHFFVFCFYFFLFSIAFMGFFFTFFFVYFSFNEFFLFNLVC